MERLLEPRSRLYMAGAIALAAVLAYVDFQTWIELDVAALYGLPLVLAAMGGQRRLIWLLTAGLLLVTFFVYARQIPAGAFSFREPFFLNRVLDGLAVVLTAGLLHALIRANERIARQNEHIRRQNEELERRRREAELASERKTRLLASMSHDIGTPLTSINMLANLIGSRARGVSAPGSIDELVCLLESSTRSLGELVSDLLELASLESGRLELRQATFSLTELLAEECRSLQPLAQAKGLRLSLAPSAPMWLRTDRIKLARVVRNLLTNAIKFTESGSITAGCAVAGDEVVVRVSDTGIGIAAQDLERIFVEFTRVATGGGHNAEGWGMGLAICKRLTELMGGRITVSSAPGQGSEFVVHLPAGHAP